MAIAAAPATPAPVPAGRLILGVPLRRVAAFYAMVFGTMFFPTNWSQSFVDDARITMKASDEVNWPPSETYTFRNPKSGLTYRAHTIGTEDVLGNQHQRSTGARMLEWANHLLALAYDVQKDINGNVIFNADGTPALKLDVNGLPVIVNPLAEADLKKFVDSIDLFHQLTTTFEQPLDTGSLPQPCRVACSAVSTLIAEVATRTTSGPSAPMGAFGFGAQTVSQSRWHPLIACGASRHTQARRLGTFP